jgi:hypothetical protein
MAQVGALVAQFAKRRTGDVAAAADAMRVQLKSGRDATQTAFAALAARREAAVADLQVSTSNLPVLPAARARALVQHLSASD